MMQKPQVHTINVPDAKNKVKQCPKVVQDYVNALEKGNERKMDIIKEQNAEIRGQAKFIKKIKK